MSGAVFDVDDLLLQCREAALGDTPALNVQQVLERALRDRAAVAAAFGHHGKAELAVLHADDSVVVLNAVWAPGMHFPPHDHRTWAVIGIYGGDEDNAFFRRVEGGGIEQVSGRSFGEGEVAVLGPSVIHAVTNPRTQSFTGAIHVYGGPYLTAPRSMWQEPDMLECPNSFEASRAIFEEANRHLATG